MDSISDKALTLVVDPNAINAAHAASIHENLGCQVTHVSSVPELFPLLSDCKFHTDLIIIDLQHLYNTSGADAFDIINTISTLAKCTLARTVDGKTYKRNPVLAALIDVRTDLKLLKGLIGTDIKGVVPRGEEFTIAEKETAIRELLAGNCYMPKKFLDKLRPHDQQKIKGIELTARQEQVLHLICERGASNKTIAKMLNIAESTVKLHVAQVFKKYGVRNRTQLVLFAK